MTETWRVTTHTARSSQAIARKIGASLMPGVVIAFSGDLGAGKTTFIQGLAEGLRITDTSQVLSPTYTLVNEYPGFRVTLVHIDLYRLDSADAARALGIDEQVVRRDAVVAVEWADKLPELIPETAVWIRMAPGEGDEREIEVTGLAQP